jgi:hypothetical protein
LQNRKRRRRQRRHAADVAALPAKIGRGGRVHTSGFLYQLCEKLKTLLSINLTWCDVQFIDAINSSVVVVALQTAFAKPFPATKRPSLRVWPAFTTILWSVFDHTKRQSAKRFHEKFNVKICFRDLTTFLKFFSRVSCQELKIWILSKENRYLKEKWIHFLIFQGKRYNMFILLKTGYVVMKR